MLDEEPLAPDGNEAKGTGAPPPASPAAPRVAAAPSAVDEDDAGDGTPAAAAPLNEESPTCEPEAPVEAPVEQQDASEAPLEGCADFVPELTETQPSEAPLDLAEAADVVPELQDESLAPTETGGATHVAHELAEGRSQDEPPALHELELATISLQPGAEDETDENESASSRAALRVVVATFNAGNAPIHNLGAWIPPLGRIAALSEGAREPVFADVVAVGMQESTWSAAQARRASAGDFGGDEDDDDGEEDDDEADGRAAESTEPPDAESAGVCDSSKDGLLAAFAAHLGEAYVLVERVHRLQMRLIVFARKPLADEVSDVQSAAENTGLGHVVANKGGQLVRFKVRDTTLAFISCHLNAHEGEARRRRRDEDVAEILSGARCGPSFELDAGAQSHHSFFMGDMNYRVALPGYEPPAKPRQRKSAREHVAQLIQGKNAAAPEETMALNQDADDDSNSAMDDDVGARAARKRVFEQHHEAVRERLAKLEFDSLYEDGDELWAGLQQGRVLAGWTTAPPRFAPTFKVARGARALVQPDEAGSDAAKARVAATYNVKRIPSWTDRVLWRSLPAHTHRIKLREYVACDEVLSSDHKPVRAIFEVQPSPRRPPASLDTTLEAVEHPSPATLAFLRTNAGAAANDAEPVTPPLRVRFSQLRGVRLATSDNNGLIGDGSGQKLCDSTYIKFLPEPRECAWLGFLAHSAMEWAPPTNNLVRAVGRDDDTGKRTRTRMKAICAAACCVFCGIATGGTAYPITACCLMTFGCAVGARASQAGGAREVPRTSVAKDGTWDETVVLELPPAGQVHEALHAIVAVVAHSKISDNVMVGACALPLGKIVREAIDAGVIGESDVNLTTARGGDSTARLVDGSDADGRRRAAAAVASSGTRPAESGSADGARNAPCVFSQEFSEPLLHNGRDHGQLRGVIEILRPPSAAEIERTRARTRKLAAGRCGKLCFRAHGDERKDPEGADFAAMAPAATGY